VASNEGESPESLPRLGVASQKDAGGAVAQEDGHGVVVGLGEELAGGRDALRPEEERGLIIGSVRAMMEEEELG
jgi:hypothetical protein